VHPRCALEFLLGTVLSLAATASALACAAPGKVNGPTKKPAPQTAPATRLQPSLQSVQEINLERQCFRCPNRYRLTFRRDGIATRTIFSAPAEQQESRGMVTRKEFDALVMLLQREGFFDLAEVYRDPQIEDGAWATTSVVTGGLTKAVLNSNQAGPPTLVAVEDALDALGKKIVWTPASP
jgi:hypothetical protein